MSQAAIRHARAIRAEAASPRSRSAIRPATMPAPAQALQTALRTLQRTTETAAPATAPAELPVSPIALIALTSAVSFICSIDRAAMSVAILPMSANFGWDDGAKGAISSSFFAGYMITNLCGGYLATRFNPKSVLAGGVVSFLAAGFVPSIFSAKAEKVLPNEIGFLAISYPLIFKPLLQCVSGFDSGRIN